MSSSLQLQNISVVMFGARRHYAVPRILNDVGVLSRFFTDICAVQGWPRLLSAVPGAVLPKPLRRLQGRVPEGVPRERLSSFPTFGVRHQLSLDRCKNLQEQLVCHAQAAAELSELVIDTGLLGDSALFTFDRAGLELMRYVKARGGTCVMEQTVVPFRIWRRLAAEEQRRFPEWEPAVEDFSEVEWFAEREEQEWKLADLIICGSEFVKAGIEQCGGPTSICAVVPYGVDDRLHVPSRGPREQGGPLRVLTVGEVGLRKGSPYVLEAAKRMKGVAEFRLVGSVSVPDQVAATLREHLDLAGQVPRSEIKAHFQWADVLLLPSLVEGSAGAVYEALSAGLPVVCTPNTGSVVRHGHNGFVVPIRDVDAICDALAQVAKDRSLLQKLSDNALNSEADYGFEKYRDDLIECLSKRVGLAR